MTRELIDFIESMNWSVYECSDGHCELESYSPEGEDLIIELPGVTDDVVLMALKMNYEAFDAEEHAYNWYGKNRGEPSSLEILLEDAHAIEDMYRELYVMVEDFLRGKDGND